MQAKPYNELTDLELLTLVIWREARGESYEGKRAVGWCIKNRVSRPSWWGMGWHGVITKKWQFSSFNVGDPNETKWPEDDVAVLDCANISYNLLEGRDTNDLTDGATHYYDRSIMFPKAWGSESKWINTLSLGRLKFYKEKPHE